MLNLRLQQQFIHLWQHYQDKNPETTLQTLADSMREVKMNTFGWFDFKSAWLTPLKG
ncbi:hypothetical protein HGO23_15695 [Xenorhabdus budapestensis]|uniref:Transcriptional regulator SgrR N-terminal HTH domain-containing protein n=1 Tax=Xenorhabdus budapestensis TaxID=290110 RepID=A0ABX7VN62_XENBU|nr:SgrR family transcriptional regulator [Xenorhabdus budapestensis]QTL41820.1 hypothetical protein HGO23_15695 [Xenorhabdus budapestensis]